jgi:Fe-S cluster assembly iron-binding protein IscA
MFTVSRKAVSLLKATKRTEGAPPGAGIRIEKANLPEDRGAVTLRLAIQNNPWPSDEFFEQDGLRIFVEHALLEPLDGRTLDVREDRHGPALVVR